MDRSGNPSLYGCGKSRSSRTKRRKRTLLFWKQGGKCFYCRNAFPIEKLTIDHLMPLSKGGSGLRIENLVLACSPCNNAKGARLIGSGVRADTTAYQDYTRTRSRWVNQKQREPYHVGEWGTYESCFSPIREDLLAVSKPPWMWRVIRFWRSLQERFCR